MKLARIAGGGRRWLVTGLAVSGCVRATVGLGLAMVVRHLLDRAGGLAGPDRLAWAVGLALLTLTVFLLRVGEGVGAEALGQSYVNVLRRRLFAEGLERAKGWRAPGGSGPGGAFIGRLTNDLSAVRNWVSRGYARAGSALAVLAWVLPVLAWREPRVAVVIVLLAAGLGWFGRRLGRGLAMADRAARRERGRLANRVTERLAAAVAARQFGRERAEIRRVRRLGKVVGHWQIRRAWYAVALRHLSDPLPAVVIGGLAVWLAADAPRSRSPGEVGFLLVLLGMAGSAFRDLCHAWEQKVIHREACRRLRRGAGNPRAGGFDAALEPPDRAPGGEAGAPTEIAGPVTGRREPVLAFDRVAWGAVLRDVNGQVDRGARVVIQGRGGSGKSTLLRLASGVLVPSAGRVTVNGQPPDHLSGRRLRRQVQWVSAELPLLSGSVAANLSYGMEVRDTRRIETVANWCGIGDDPGNFPEGLGTRVGVGGAGLPSGARVRLSLARAAAMRPRLLLVDDPVFLLDEAAGAALRRVLRELSCAVLFAGEAGTSLIEPTEIWTLGGAGGGLRIERRVSA